MFAQIGRGLYTPEHLESAAFLSPRDLESHIRAADAVVSHAGMGTILTSLELAKSLLVMPRRADLGEHRSDHQLRTAERFADRVLVAMTESELPQLIDRLVEQRVVDQIADTAPKQLLERIRTFARDGR